VVDGSSISATAPDSLQVRGWRDGRLAADPVDEDSHLFDVTPVRVFGELGPIMAVT